MLEPAPQEHPQARDSESQDADTIPHFTAVRRVYDAWRSSCICGWSHEYHCKHCAFEQAQFHETDAESAVNA